MRQNPGHEGRTGMGREMRLQFRSSRVIAQALDQLTRDQGLSLGPGRQDGRRLSRSQSRPVIAWSRSLNGFHGQQGWVALSRPAGCRARHVHRLRLDLPAGR
jgi:hypothetical protein